MIVRIGNSQDFMFVDFAKKKKKSKWFFDFLVTLFFLLAFHLFIVGKQIEFYESISQQLT